MEEIIENPPVIPASQHPVLQALNEKIANLEDTVAVNEKALTEQRNRAWEILSNFNNYKYKVENVLRTYASDNPEQSDMLVEIASELGIELTNTKEYEVNVTFVVSVTSKFGEEDEFTEYDISADIDIPGFDFEVNDSRVVYITEA